MTGQAGFDKHSNNYGQTLRHSLKLFRRDEFFFDLLKASAIKNWVIKDNEVYDILDFGCSVGRLAGLLAKDFRRSNIFGYDISTESLEVAKKENAELKNIRFLDEFPRDHKYDFVVVANVFHHVEPEEQLETLYKIRRILKPRGKIVVFEHNPFNPCTRYIVHICPFDVDAELIWLRSFLKLADRSNMKIELKNYVFFFPWLSDRFRKVEWYLRRVPLGAQYMVTLVNK